MKTTATILTVVTIAGLWAGCASHRRLTDAEIPTATNLKDVMWAQADLTDPAFKKIGATAYTDSDWAAFVAVADRLELTTTKIKSDFHKKAPWDEINDAVAVHASKLRAAAQTRNPSAATAALTSIRTNCRACHEEFR